MKQIYKCEIDGKIFERKVDCMKHEFELKGGSKRFENEVKEACEFIENNYLGLQFGIIEVESKIDWDGDPNTNEKNYVEWQVIEIVAYNNGEPIGDIFSRGSEGYYTKEKLIEELIDEYVTPYKPKFEGYLTDNDDYYASGFDLDGVNLDKILRAMYGKKIRLEIIENG